MTKELNLSELKELLKQEGENENNIKDIVFNLIRRNSFIKENGKLFYQNGQDIESIKMEAFTSKDSRNKLFLKEFIVVSFENKNKNIKDNTSATDVKEIYQNIGTVLYDDSSSYDQELYDYCITNMNKIIMNGGE